jgi:hypothetical protein
MDSCAKSNPEMRTASLGYKKKEIFLNIFILY